MDKFKKHDLEKREMSIQKAICRVDLLSRLCGSLLLKRLNLSKFLDSNIWILNL